MNMYDFRSMQTRVPPSSPNMFMRSASFLLLIACYRFLTFKTSAGSVLNVSNLTFSPFRGSVLDKVKRINDYEPCSTDEDCLAPCQCHLESKSEQKVCIDAEVFNSLVSEANCTSCRFRNCSFEIFEPFYVYDYEENDYYDFCFGLDDKFCPTCAIPARSEAYNRCVRERDDIPQNVKCVETEWILKKGFGAFVLNRYGKSHTFCLDGFPCGTAGHVLQLCLGHRNCRLLTYKELCDMRGDCTSRFVEVCSLSSAFDWSAVQLQLSADSEHWIYLTSLGASPDGWRRTWSVRLAGLAKMLIDSGNGKLVDYITSFSPQM